MTDKNKNSNGAAGVAYRSGDEILLMRRKPDRNNGGMWSLPAGHIENGESPQQAAFREFSEETGHDLDLSAMQSISEDKGFAAFEYRGTKFDVMMNDEHDAWQWANINDMPQPLHPGLWTILQNESESKNASQEPRAFYCRHMQPGICGYQNETILVDTDALKRLVASAKDRGIPVYIHHNDDTQETRLKNLRDQACGFITDSFYNELDGWAWFKFLAVEDSAHKAIENGWRVSNAYIPERWGSGGTKNNLPYDRELLEGNFTHLAIVPNPRYESACIMSPEQFKAYNLKLGRELEELRNSKEGSPPMKLFNILRKEAAPSEITAETQVELQNEAGATETVSVGDMVKAVLNAKSKKNADKDAMVKCGDDEMSVDELSNAYMALRNERKNAEEEAKKKKDDEEKENAAKAKKNEEDEVERKKKEEDEKKNGHFTELANANKVLPTVRVIEPSMDGVARGKKRYGSAG